MYYIDNKFKNDGNTIIFLQSVVLFPDAVAKEYNVFCYDSFFNINKQNNDKHFKKLKNLYILKKKNRMYNNYIRFVYKVVEDKAACSDCTIFVFSDNGSTEFILSKVFDLTLRIDHKIKCVLIEEGLALYSCTYNTDKSFKYYIKRLLGLSDCIINPVIMGMNKYISEVWCSDPEKFKLKRNDIKVIKEDDVFTPEHSKKIMRLFAQNDNIRLPDDVKYVFLTQPYDFTNEMFKKFKHIMTILTAKGKVLIKKHPRDKFNYNQLQNDNIIISSDELQKIPFECIYRSLEDVTLLTYYSSAAIIKNSKRKPIFLYKLFCSPEEIDRINNFEINWRNISVCDTFEDLNNLIFGGNTNELH